MVTPPQKKSVSQGLTENTTHVIVWHVLKQAKVAQLVEHSTENAGVISSILILGTFSFLRRCKASSQAALHPFLLEPEQL